MAESMTGASDPLFLVPALYPKTGLPRRVGNLDSFIISGMAPAGAVIFTNPFDTAKVRLQLQGQQQQQQQSKNNNNTSSNNIITKKNSKPSQKIYKNSMDTLYKIYKNEGIKGLQKGLFPAILRESSKNFFRIGMYDPIMKIMHNTDTEGSAPAWKRLVAGSMCGVMGAFSCNPFELVKTRLQAMAAGNIAVGHQHEYTGTWNALKSIIKNDGFTGLYRGSVLSMGRSVVGSGTNLASFTMAKEYLILDKGWNDCKTLDVVCGLGSAVISVICMNPIDVVRTRYYNQEYKNGKGVQYSSGFGAAKMIFFSEGPRAFYKGLVTHFFRIGPHFCFTFLFLGMLRRGLGDYYGYLDRKESFAYFDSDNDGKLNSHEVHEALKKIFITTTTNDSNDANDDDKTTSNQENNSIMVIDENVLMNYTNRIIQTCGDVDGNVTFEMYKKMTDELRNFL